MTNKDVKQISIRLLPDGFSFSEEFHPITPGADFEQRMEESLLNAGINQTDADEVCCSVETLRFNLSPAKTEEKEADLMYRLTLPDTEREEVLLSETDVTNEIRLTYGIDAELYHFLRRNIEEISFTHPLLVLHNTWSQNEATSQDCMIAQDCGVWLNILIYKGNKLFMANRFASPNTNSSTYFIMNAWQKSGLDVLDNKLHLLTENDDLRQQISKYIKQCE